MKTTGIVRRLDEFGRVSLPVELRKNLLLDDKSQVEFYVERDAIIIKKYQPCCVFCGESVEVQEYMDKLVCDVCVKNLHEQLTMKA